MMLEHSRIGRSGAWPKYIVIVMSWGLLVYIAFAWLIFRDSFLVDFTSLYASVNALWQDTNPYQVLKSDFIDVARKLPVNLNPPIVLLTFMPMHLLSYKAAMALWFLMLTACAFANLYLASLYGCPFDFWKRYRIYFILIYLTSFSSIMGLAIAQMGTFIAFWVMLGYHFYRNKAYQCCALCWAYITVCKLFPAVLLLFCLQQRHYRLAAYYAFYGLIFSLLPALVFGIGLYVNYAEMMSRVMWYGDSWNASFFGVVGRLWIDTANIHVSLGPYHLIWLAIALPILLFYLCRHQLNSHLSFIIALVLMIILSPFGWMYYFALLFIALLYAAEKAEKSNYLWIWFVALVMMNLPVDYVVEKYQGGLLPRLSLFSAHFYGLLVLLILLLQPEKKYQYHAFSSIRLPIILNQIFNLCICSVIIFYHFLYFQS